MKKAGPPFSESSHYSFHYGGTVPTRSRVRNALISKRRRPDSNRCIKVLQTSPLPLGYGAASAQKNYYTYAKLPRKNGQRQSNLLKSSPLRSFAM